MQMSRKLFNAIKEATSLDIRDDYSGRFMYGSKCFAIVAPNPTTATYQVCKFLATVDEAAAIWEEANDFLDNSVWSHARMDELGLDYILYFPGITVEP